MTVTDAFGPIVSRWKFASRVCDELKAWMPEYLAAADRQQGRAGGKTILPKSWDVRHASLMRPQAQLPGVVVWLAGVTNQRTDPDDDIWGDIEFGVALVVSTAVKDATGETLHRYVAAVSALLYDRRTLGGTCSDVIAIDEDFTGIDPRRDRVRLSAELRFVATGVHLGRRGVGPGTDDTPRPDPNGPRPGTPTVLKADFTIDGRPYVDPED